MPKYTNFVAIFQIQICKKNWGRDQDVWCLSDPSPVKYA